MALRAPSTPTRRIDSGVGSLLKTWRARRRLSQLDLAALAEVSTRHLSYVETGRSRPSRELLLHLARHLDVPLRDQNDLLLAAGHAPAFDRLDIHAPEMSPVVDALNTMLTASDPHPALVMDRHWNLVMANESAFAFTEGVADHLISPSINVLRLTLHPDGLAQYVTNFDAVAWELLERVRRSLTIGYDETLADLLGEMEHLVGDISAPATPSGAPSLPLTVVRNGVTTKYLSVISTFGSALDVTTSELTIETFYDVTDAPG